GSALASVPPQFRIAAQGWERTATADTEPGPPRLCASPMSAPGTCICPARPGGGVWVLLIIRMPDEPIGWPHDLSPPDLFTGRGARSRVSPARTGAQPAPRAQR